MNHPFKVGDLVSEVGYPLSRFMISRIFFIAEVPFVELAGYDSSWEAARFTLFKAPPVPPTKHKLGVPKGKLP